MTRNKLYLLLGISCMAGYVWLMYNYLQSTGNNEVGACMVKHLTDIPCPSCGSTRSVLSILSGNLMDSLYWNPMGIILFLIMVSAPVWIIFDQITKKDTLFLFYNKIEAIFKNKMIAIPAILLVVVNWIWNIFKGL